MNKRIIVFLLPMVCTGGHVLGMADVELVAVEAELRAVQVAKGVAQGVLVGARQVLKGLERAAGFTLTQLAATIGRADWLLNIKSIRARAKPAEIVGGVLPGVEISLTLLGKNIKIGGLSFNVTDIPGTIRNIANRLIDEAKKIWPF